jgi:hypothetical protein
MKRRAMKNRSKAVLMTWTGTEVVPSKHTLRNIFRPHGWWNCTDCGIHTSRRGEVYMVQDDVWERAWRDRPRCPLQEILCIGCLETRIGRTLTRHDFTDWPINHDECHRSDRLRDRLTAEGPPRKLEP